MASDGKRFYVIAFIIFNALMILLFLAVSLYFIFVPTSMAGYPTYARVILGGLLMLYALFRSIRLFAKLSAYKDAE